MTSISAHVKQLSALGPVEMSELDVSGTINLTQMADGESALVDAGLNAGCTSVDFYQALRFDPTKSENFSLSAKDFSRALV